MQRIFYEEMRRCAGLKAVVPLYKDFDLVYTITM